ncbi:hypothetical protein LCGC14_2021790 [marine sediment metagenome]|uniref:Uncharacterized protein n=1 Tax=marine sediment metagenome TaxID=412755 RepID=A0A0F9FJW1_9ZZZZ
MRNRPFCSRQPPLRYWLAGNHIRDVTEMVVYHTMHRLSERVRCDSITHITWK